MTMLRIFQTFWFQKRLTNNSVRNRKCLFSKRYLFSQPIEVENEFSVPYQSNHRLTGRASKSDNRAEIEKYNESLFFAAKNGKLDDVRLLLDKGAEVDS